MNCLFCKQPCHFPDNGSIGLCYFECRVCEAQFTVHNIVGMTDYQFVVRNFRVTCVLTPPPFTEVTGVYVPYEVVLKLPYVLDDINPSNFLQKLPMLKVFG